MINNVPFFDRKYSENTENQLVGILRNGFLTSGKVGMHVEDLLESYFDISGAALMNSWTNGAVVALSCMGIGEGDEVIVPAMTFVATASSVKCVNAKPILCDVCPETGNISWEFIQPKLTDNTKAIFVVHMYGLMMDVKLIRDSLDEIGRQDVEIIEDAAHCFEGEFDNYKPGKYSKCAIFSFYATKNISCGEGGAVISSDKEFIDACFENMIEVVNDTYHDVPSPVMWRYAIRRNNVLDFYKEELYWDIKLDAGEKVADVMAIYGAAKIQSDKMKEFD